MKFNHNYNDPYFSMRAYNENFDTSKLNTGSVYVTKGGKNSLGLLLTLALQILNDHDSKPYSNNQWRETYTFKTILYDIIHKAYHLKVEPIGLEPEQICSMYQGDLWSGLHVILGYMLHDTFVQCIEDLKEPGADIERITSIMYYLFRWEAQVEKQCTLATVEN